MTAFIKLTTAMAMFEDESLELTFTERLNLIRQAIIVYEVNNLKKIADDTKYEVPDKEDAVVKNLYKILKRIEQIHNAQIRSNKALGKNSDDNDRSWLDAIKKSESSIGAIVRDLRETA